MFTGLIQDIGTLRSAERTGEDLRYEVQTALSTADFALGESIAVNGVCLTVTAFGSDWFRADLSYETVKTSALGELRAGARVHLERALRVGDRLGGHWVQGHVDGPAWVTRSAPRGKAWELELRMDRRLVGELVEKGSIAVDGVSLTVNRLGSETCTLTIVPHTSSETLLTAYAVGRSVNIETDVLGKYVKRFLGVRDATLEDRLRAFGYLDSSTG